MTRSRPNGVAGQVDPGAEPRSGLSLGLRANLALFAPLVVINALVGGMQRQERAVPPLLAQREFHQTSDTAALTYLLAFGVAKAATNNLAGTWSARYGRKPVLVSGWLVALPVPVMRLNEAAATAVAATAAAATAVAATTSGLVVALRTYDTHPTQGAAHA